MSKARLGKVRTCTVMQLQQRPQLIPPGPEGWGNPSVPAPVVARRLAIVPSQWPVIAQSWDVDCPSLRGHNLGGSSSQQSRAIPKGGLIYEPLTLTHSLYMGAKCLSLEGGPASAPVSTLHLSRHNLPTAPSPPLYSKHLEDRNQVCPTGSLK